MTRQFPTRTRLLDIFDALRRHFFPELYGVQVCEDGLREFLLPYLSESVLQQFLGRIEQIPPTYSAVKVEGKRAYDLARKEKDVQLKPKILVIDKIDLLQASLHPSLVVDGSPIDASLSAPDAPSPLLPRTGMRNKAFLTSPSAPNDTSSYPSITIRVVCSKGTYIRALARDIGQALGSGAHLTALRRTRVGDIRVEDCITMDTFPTWIDQQEIEMPQ